jgi:signal transduction histidine kinase
VSLVLAADHRLDDGARRRCHAEVEAALAELRDALRSPLASSPPQVTGTLRDEIERLRRRHDDLALRLVDGEDVELPPRLEPLAQAVLDEAVRNARRHAQPSRIDVSVVRRKGTLVLEIVNDGVEGESAPARGMGLRLASLEAVQQGGVVEFGERGPGEWHVRLVVPAEALT